MKTAFNLSIAKPCSANWQEFIPDGNGRVCESCNKTVVDFTRMTDDEIIYFFKNKSSSTCGRFHSGQLKLYTAPSEVKIKPGFVFLKAGFLGLLFLLVNKPVAAQSNTERHAIEIRDRKSNRLSENNSISDSKIRGTVTSEEDGSPIAGVNVIWKGSTFGTTTDSDGHFEFPQPLSAGDILQFSFIGLITEEYTIPAQLPKPFEIKMKMSFEMMGEVDVHRVYTEKKSGLSIWWSKFKAHF